MCRIRGFISTCRKQGLNIFQSITDIMAGNSVPFSYT
jgi:hypothetical protein